VKTLKKSFDTISTADNENQDSVNESQELYNLAEDFSSKCSLDEEEEK
jgi:hypothetical protein